MSLRDNKMAVLRQLGLEPEPISLPELMLKLGKGFKTRSVRRWLSLLVEEGTVRKIGKKRGTKYIAAGRSEEGLGEVSSCFSSASLNAIEEVNKPIFERLPVAYADDWFNSYQPNSSYYLSQRVRQQLLALGQRTSGQDPAGTYAHQIFHRLIIDLSYNSSRLEGNTYSLLDTERLLLHGDTAEGKLDEELPRGGVWCREVKMTPSPTTDLDLAFNGEINILTQGMNWPSKIKTTQRLPISLKWSNIHLS